MWWVPMCSPLLLETLATDMHAGGVHAWDSEGMVGSAVRGAEYQESARQRPFKEGIPLLAQVQSCGDCIAYLLRPSSNVKA